MRIWEEVRNRSSNFFGQCRWFGIRSTRFFSNLFNKFWYFFKITYRTGYLRKRSRTVYFTSVSSHNGSKTWSNCTKHKKSKSTQVSKYNKKIHPK